MVFLSLLFDSSTPLSRSACGAFWWLNLKWIFFQDKIKKIKYLIVVFTMALITWSQQPANRISSIFFANFFHSICVCSQKIKISIWYEFWEPRSMSCESPDSARQSWKTITWIWRIFRWERRGKSSSTRIFSQFQLTLDNYARADINSFNESKQPPTARSDFSFQPLAVRDPNLQSGASTTEQTLSFPITFPIWATFSSTSRCYNIWSKLFPSE